MSEPLQYWGTWKGRVIKAISIDGVYSWEEIRDLTGLSRPTLNQVLAELFDAKAIYKLEDGQYRVSRELYRDYNTYFRNLNKNEEIKEKKVVITKDQQSNLKSRIDQWKDTNRLNISLKSGHFYLDTDFLDQFSKFVIKGSQKELLIVNPFVSKCNLSDSLLQAVNEGKNVTLVTRPPDTRNSLYGEKSDEYHKIIRNSGIELIYFNVVHAKLMVIDRAVAIASSMNMTVTSTAGASWEAGIISVEENVVESVMDSIRKLIETPESKTQ